MTKEAMKLALEALNKLTDAAGGFSVSGVYFNEGVWEQECLNAAYDAIKALEEALAKQEPKPFGYTLEETMKCWDLGYAAAVKALAKKEQPYADKAASVSNDRIKIDPVTGNVQIGTSKQEQSAEHVGEPVGEMQLSAIYEGMVVPVVPVELPAGTKLYTTPQPKQEHGEPVMRVRIERSKSGGLIGHVWWIDDSLVEGMHDLYTTQQQQRKPLNKKQRIAIIESLEFENSQQELIDAVEAAHGIKE